MKRHRLTVAGKLMLAGEYSVLQGGRALAVTVDRFLSATAIGTSDGHPGQTVTLRSSHWSQEKTLDLNSGAQRLSPFEQAVLMAQKHYNAPLARVEIDSDIDLRFGVGSSSALRLAVTGAIATLRHADDSPWQWARMSYEGQRQAQKKASGYDIATQLCGGLLEFRQQPDQKEWPSFVKSHPDKLDRCQAITQVYIGPRGSATAPLLNATTNWLDQMGLWPELHADSEALVEALLDILDGERSSITPLCRAVAKQRALFEKGPTYPSWLNQFKLIPGCDDTWSFKTTGAGGEDALLFFGNPPPAVASLLEKTGWEKAPFKFCNHRLNCDHQTVSVPLAN